METHEEILGFVIEKRNELANELYDFWGGQKQEIYSSFYTQIDSLNKHLVEYVDYKIQFFLNEWTMRNRRDQEFIYIKAFFESNLKCNNSKIIVLGNPEHGNIGDHAITCGEKTFLRENFSECPVLFLSWRMLKEYESYLTCYIDKKDIICITGGGFLGTLWMEEQQHVNEALRQFQDNPIIILPQTFWYDENDDAAVMVEEFEQALNGCVNICVCLRDRESLNRFQMRYPCIRTLLIPDMALYLHPRIKQKNTNDILFCMRMDKEKCIQKELEWKNLVGSKGYSYHDTTTVIDENIPLDLSEKYVWDKLHEFANAKLVITDRLHGMIFAALVNTPCIAFNNVSKKVEGVYYWLKKLSTVQIVKDEQDFLQVFEHMEANLVSHDRMSCDFNYDSLIQYLKDKVAIEK